ncbi:hypothetical protein JCM16303_006004 [Sporobolomyces ruberrimus]
MWLTQCCGGRSCSSYVLSQASTARFRSSSALSCLGFLPAPAEGQRLTESSSLRFEFYLAVDIRPLARSLLLIMRLLPSLAIALSASIASASAIPLDTREVDPSLAPLHLEKRQGHCHDGMTPLVAYDNKLVCLGGRAFWIGSAISAIGQRTVQAIATQMTDWIESSVTGSREAASGRRLARREAEESQELVRLEVGGVEAGVPFVQDAQGKTTINILDFLVRSPTPLETRDVSESEPTVIGGSATYHSDGALDTFTLDFAVPSSAYASDDSAPSTLAKRGAYTLHTTYWAWERHGETSLNWNDVHSLALASFLSLPKGVSQACGYMANSGTWHGSFRHWTGDSGYQVGDLTIEECNSLSVP